MDTYVYRLSLSLAQVRWTYTTVGMCWCLSFVSFHLRSTGSKTPTVRGNGGGEGVGVGGRGGGGWEGSFLHLKPALKSGEGQFLIAMKAPSNLPDRENLIKQVKE